MTENVNDAATAAALTNSALNKGIRAHYATSAYSSPPSYFSAYVSQIGSNSYTPEPTSTESGNTTGTVTNTPAASGGLNEYCFYLLITNTTVSGITVGQQVWCASSTTDFPELLTPDVTLTGNLDRSLGWWVFRSTKPNMLPAPTNVDATDGTYSDKVQITWTNVSDATSYKVFRSTTNSKATAAQIGTATASPYNDTTAVAGTTYYYWVKATNASGDSGFSASNSGWR